MCPILQVDDIKVGGLEFCNAFDRSLVIHLGFSGSLVDS